MLVFALAPVLLGSQLSKAYSPLIFASYGVLGFSLFSRGEGKLIYLSPNSLIFFYVVVSMFLGSIALNAGAVLVKRNFIEYGSHVYTHFAISFLMVGLISLPLTEIKNSVRYAAVTSNTSISSSRYFCLLIFLVMCLGLNIDFSVLGGSGSLNRTVFILLSVATFAYAKNFKSRSRYLVYFACFLIMALMSSHNKRDAIFLVSVIVLCEATRGTKIKYIRAALLSLVACLISLVTIIAMSINRGYGGYISDQGLLVALSYIPDYLSSEFFWAAFFQNIEVSYFYFHYVNAIEIILRGSEDLSFGATLIKPLFLFLPRDLAPWKPTSIIELYTVAYDPDFRTIGGSWPPNFAAEFFWNFHLLGLIMFPVIAIFFAWLYRKTLDVFRTKKLILQSFLLFIYQNSVTYARGSGVDQLVFDCLVVGGLAVGGALLHAILTRAIR
ncbi:MAG: hypothetical protein VW421_01415 [Gammaproteobacteria bacterium]